MKVQARQDVSYLFSSLGTGASNAVDSNLLVQYASIKNGSYAKLLKAYYSESSNETVDKLVGSSQSTSTLTSGEAKAITNLQSATDSLKESADALLENGKDSVFRMKDITTKDESGKETTVKGYDTDAVYDAVNSFVKDYNAVVGAAKDVSDSGILNKVTNMMNTTVVNEKGLNQIGITIREDNTLSIDKEVFQKADMSKVKNMFNSTGSYGYGISAKASLIDFAADHAVSRASIYTGNGTYNNIYNTGNIFDGIF